MLRSNRFPMSLVIVGSLSDPLHFTGASVPVDTLVRKMLKDITEIPVPYCDFRIDPPIYPKFTRKIANLKSSIKPKKKLDMRSKMV